ncbi:hypothetical protein HHL22_16675 [Hymenobacter sp. RP-2-7]|uniref:Outer membrane protein beta-barrel domain-containing protein n=1 Tax=Hymenobacter polaris TaxID=2682546 RepID=A0A7Y0AGM8_9BACT|nr:hypothetical protein [Hymenobacter polaris]NML66842.1 hypothetical protein [Hymenobacter polaris]
MKKLLYLASVLGSSLLATAPALAQANQTPPPTGPTFEAPAGAMPSDEQSYRREVVFGLNFNTQGGLIGGVNVRVASVLDEHLLRFWSLEGVSFKNPKEERVTNPYTGGTYTRYKTNYALALRPSFGVQRILFRKAAESGVQVNALLSAGPSIAFLMPYYISFDYDAQRRRQFGASDIIINEQYDPSKHAESDFIVDRAPLFSGIGQTKIVPGAHLRGGLSFEYGRYRDAVAGAEVGFLMEVYTKRLDVLAPPAPTDPNTLNKQFYPSVYLTLYLGHRS